MSTLHERLVVVDALQSSDWNRARFQELRAGGLSAVHVTVAFWEDARATLSAIGRWHRWFRAHADLIVPCLDGADIAAAARAGRTAIILGAQNASPFEDDLALVEVFHRLGLRVAQLTYNNQSLVGAGCYEAADGGLTRFGREVIAEMNRLGMVVDLSHVGERTSLDAIAASVRPVAITHANPAWFHAVARNKSDAVLKALVVRGGMLGFSLYPLHVGGSDVTLEAVIAMIARTADQIGIDHLGFGTDMCLGRSDAYLGWMRSGRWTFDETPACWPVYPSWYASPADFPNLTEGLLRAGFAEADVAALMGGNWLRFFTEGFRPQGAGT